MKKVIETIMLAFAVTFAANANTTYYFQGTPGEETYIWGNTQWKTADGTAKMLFQNSSGTRDRTADLSKFRLQSKPSWASRLGIVDGNLVLWPCEPGLSLSVR